MRRRGRFLRFARNDRRTTARDDRFDDKASSAGDVAEEEGVVGKAGGGPLGEVAVGAHDTLGGLENGPQGGEVRRNGGTNDE